ncbi:MAG: hypothetical protein ACLR0V_11725 [Roseburia hominis]
MTALGIRCEEEEMAVTIYPGSPHGGNVETYDDHRVAMAFSLIGLRTDGIVIENPACCRKTFEDYFTVLSRTDREEDGGVKQRRLCMSNKKETKNRCMNY